MKITKNKIVISLNELGITEDDIDCDIKILEEGGMDVQYKMTEEAHHILSAFCNALEIDPGELLKATALSEDGSVNLKDLQKKSS